MTEFYSLWCDFKDDFIEICFSDIFSEIYFSDLIDSCFKDSSTDSLIDWIYSNGYSIDSSSYLIDSFTDEFLTDSMSSTC